MNLSVLNYKNYRSFLKDFYEEKKKENPRYSFAVFANKAGMASPNYLKRVIDGSRNITHNNIRNFILGLALPKKEADFFQNLVFFNQSDQKETQAFYFGELSRMAQKSDTNAFHMDADFYEYLSNWYYVAIHEMVNLKDFQENPDWIIEKLKFKITKPQIKKAIDLLLKLGLLKRSPEGELEQANRELQYLKEVRNLAIQKFHKQMMELAITAIDKEEHTERDVSSLTVCVKEGDYDAIKKRIEVFREELNQTFSCIPKEGTHVLQMNFQLFPLTRRTP